MKQIPLKYSKGVTDSSQAVALINVYQYFCFEIFLYNIFFCLNFFYKI